MKIRVSWERQSTTSYLSCQFVDSYKVLLENVSKFLDISPAYSFSTLFRSSLSFSPPKTLVRRYSTHTSHVPSSASPPQPRLPSFLRLWGFHFLILSAHSIGIWSPWTRVQCSFCSQAWSQMGPIRSQLVKGIVHQSSFIIQISHFG